VRLAEEVREMDDEIDRMNRRANADLLQLIQQKPDFTQQAMNALLETAAGPPDCGGHEAACVLSMLTDQRAAAAAANWKRRNDGYEDAEANEIDFNGRKVKTWKMDDVMRANMPNFVRECSERVHREYGPLFSQWSSPRIGGI